MKVLMYVDDFIIVGPSMKDIGGFVESKKIGCEKFVLTDKRDINIFFGIKMTQIDEKIFKISHLFLIDRIIYFINIETNNYGMETNAKSTPIVKPLLHKYSSGKPHEE